MKWTRRGLLGLAVLILGGWVCFRILNAVFPFPWQNLEPPSAVRVLDCQDKPLRFFLAADDMWRFPVGLDDISQEMLRTFLASEDRYFYRHPGVNPLAVMRAAWTNLIHGRIISGGSTITMQLARLAEPKDRTLAAKAVEAFRALQLERRFSKDEILERYLNLTPYGGNIVGLGAAAYFYFGKTPDRLSLGEAALLVILPRSPNGYDPVKHPEAALKARNRLLDMLAERKVFTRDEVDAAKNLPLPTRIRKPPFSAPQFCRLALSRSRPSSVIRTTLDMVIQRKAEEKLKQRVDWLRARGIENGAIVIIETKTRKLRAMVGSASFFEDLYHGQINGAVIKRSPGSTLKPFLYALAFDQGLVVPQSILLDIPTDFSGYVAKNYDNQYRGRVTVEEALMNSLNAPAVRLLHEVGLARFFKLLTSCGLHTLDKPMEYYGLPLVLGAGEVTLLDLTTLYAMLAGLGEYKPVQMFEGLDTSEEPAENVLSPEACWLVGQILTQVQRGETQLAWDLTRDAPVVAWKTGTSFGHRDAWAVGFSSTYTVGVWVGNLDGRPEKGISGARHAGPLLFDVMRAIEKSGALPRPFWLDIEEVEVCTESRHLPNGHCPQTMRIEYLPGKSNIPVDTMHKLIYVDDETGQRLEGDCLAHRAHHTEVITEYPVELLAWQRSQGMEVKALPPLHPDCRFVPEDDRLKIVSPNADTPYRIRGDAPLEFQRIALQAQSAEDATELYWYQDGVLVGSGPPDAKLFITPELGEHRIVVMDNLGREDGLTFNVYR